MMLTSLLIQLFYRIPSNNIIASLARFYIVFIFSLISEIFDAQFSMTLKRISFLIFFLVFVPLNMTWNHIGFLLDDLLFPEWRAVEILSPIFIVGNARSGTTYMHRLFSLDESSFCFFRTWELLVGVSITWRKLFIKLYDMDQFYLKGYLYSLLCQLENHMLANCRTHVFGLQQAEEDDWLMCHISLSQLITFFFPAGCAIFGNIIVFDNSVNSLTEKLIFSYYKDCIRRHMFVRNFRNLISLRKTYVSKSPPFTNRIPSLNSEFPDCRVVCLVRDPVEAVPSMISYISQVNYP